MKKCITAAPVIKTARILLHVINALFTKKLDYTGTVFLREKSTVNRHVLFMLKMNRTMVSLVLVIAKKSRNVIYFAIIDTQNVVLSS